MTKLAFFILIFLAIVYLIIALFPLRRSRGVLLLCAPLLLGLLVVFYTLFGGWHDWQLFLSTQAKKQEVERVLSTLHSSQELIERLKQRLREQPESARGWYLLGRIYASQDQWTLAKDAFAKAYLLKPKDEQIAVNYAQSLWQCNQQHMDANCRKIFQKVLKKNPKQPDSLAMLAMDAYMSHAYSQAISYWQQLLTIVPADSEDAMAIRKAIVKARQALSTEAEHSR